MRPKQNQPVGTMQPSPHTISAFLNISPAVLFEYVQNRDGNGIITYISPNSIEILGYSAEKFINRDLSGFLEITHPEDGKRLEIEDSESVDDPFFTSDVRIILPSKKVRWLRIRSKPAAKTDAGVTTWVGCIVDISLLKHNEEELKQLRGILPLCSYCKKIRNDEGYWTRVDHYISQHSEAEISHSICPDCMKEKHPEYADYL